ncbi:TolC family protein [Marinicella sp. W31]|uniref:TolC family protein n=1 Tax=Marinicella sp. W31 TaxID=3023713 RepID=UPI0037583038
MKYVQSIVLCLVANTTIPSSAQAEMENEIQLSNIVEEALENDPWIKGSWHDQNKMESLGIAAGELPDPVVTLGVANLAADTFDFDQERMTHLKMGILQRFPRGNSRKLGRDKLKIESEQYPHLRENRKGEITLRVSHLWLNLYRAQESIRIINQSLDLFEKLVEVVESNYIAAVTKTTQFDIVQTELEMSFLDDRLAVLKQEKEFHIAQLSQWLGYQVNDGLNVSQRLPNINPIQKQTSLLAHLAKHPAIKAFDKQIDSSDLGIELSRQKYKPAWSLNLGYGYRENAPTGTNRSDLLSISVNFDVPLFKANRQDQEVNAAVQTKESMLTKKEQMLRTLMNIHETSTADLENLRSRASLYESKLLPQTKQSIEIALNAYSADEGDFSEVVRAQISELDASLELLKIQVAIQKTILSLNYALMKSADDILNSSFIGESL